MVVLDTQVYSNTGGQACTSGFTGQVADMSAFGTAQHGKTEVRKELGLLAIAHRGVFVHQSSQASAAHLMGGVLKGLQKRRPALFNIYTPCPVEHGLADDGAAQAARFALESRAFPVPHLRSGRRSIFFGLPEPRPAIPRPTTDWPRYTLRHLDEADVAQTIEVPLTIADWAATEGRFKQHFADLPRDQWDDAVPFDEYLRMPRAEREGKAAFIHAVGPDRRLRPPARGS